MAFKNSYNSSKVAERIKQQAKLRNISIKDLLSECDLGVNTISKLANEKDIYLKNFVKIAYYLECSADYLLGMKENYKLNLDIKQDHITEHEQALLDAYRKNAEMQSAVDKLLGIESQRMRAVKVARSNNSKVEEMLVDFSDLINAPDVLNDDDI